MKYYKFAVDEYLRTDEDCAAYLSEMLEANDPDIIMAALGDIARARGMASLAKSTGLNRESLYKALRPGSKPRFETVLRIIHGLNLRLQTTVAAEEA